MPSLETQPHTPPYSSRARAMRPSAIRQILKITGIPDLISFAGGLPAPELFPVAEMRRAAHAVFREDGAGSLQYDVSEGHLPLRRWVCSHLEDTVGLHAAPERVLITNGSQQGLDLVSKILLDPGDIVLVENPAYLGALQAFRSYEADIRALPADGDGMDPNALEDFLRHSACRPKFLYLAPNFQNPTGTTTSAERRLELAAIAADHGLLVLEDDPYNRLRYDGEDLSAISALSFAPNWIYLGSTSKILAPGLRVAWIATADPELHERLVLAKQSADLHTSSLTQRLVCQFVEQPGVLAAHIRRLRAAYAARRDAMLTALEAHLPEGSTWTRPDGGLFLWVTLPPAIDTMALLQACTAQKVAFVPGAPFWTGAEVRNTLRLNFSHSSEAKIAEGIARLGLAAAPEI